MCVNVPFTLWVDGNGNGCVSFLYEMHALIHTLIHAFRASEQAADNVPKCYGSLVECDGQEAKECHGVNVFPWTCQLGSCVHVPYTLWVYGNVYATFLHVVHALIHPFHTSE